MHALLTRIARPFVAPVTVALLGSALLVAPGAAADGVSVSTILNGYDRPVIAVAPVGSSRRIFIVEQSGRIKVASWSGSAWVKVGTFLDLRSRVKYDGSEQGLLGLAFAPDYATSHRFYVDYTRKPDGATVIAEFKRSRTSVTKAVASSYRLVTKISQPYANHNGGMIAFGPDDLLYSARATVGATPPSGPSPWARVWARCCASTPGTRMAADRSTTVSRRATRSWTSAEPAPRSGPVACAIHGAGRSTG